MKRSANTVINVVLVLALLAFPVLAVVLLIQGDWGPAAIIVLVGLMTWWRGRHGGRYVPESLRLWFTSRRRR